MKTIFAISLLSYGFGALAQVGTVDRLSTSASGVQGNHESLWPSVSANGAYVVFASTADNLVVNDVNGVSDVFIKNRLTGAIELVSVTTGGQQGNGTCLTPVMSPDARFVAFVSESTNFIANDTNGNRDVFVRDRQTGTTLCGSVSSQGEVGNQSSIDPTISADGRYVVFSSSSTNLDGGTSQIFLHDFLTAGTIMVSINTGGQAGNSSSNRPTISEDGQIIVFESNATNLVSGDTNTLRDVFMFNRASGTTSRISLTDTEGEANQGSSVSTHRSMSSNARFVVFSSYADNLVAGDTNLRSDVFVRDLLDATTTRLSLSTLGAEADKDCLNPAISGNGRFIAFQSASGLLFTGDVNNLTDVFVRDQILGTLVLVSRSTAGVQGNGSSLFASLNASGQLCAFESTATTLVPDDTNGWHDVFLADQLTHAPTAFEYVRGTNAVGDLLSLVYSDNNRLASWPGPVLSTSQDPVQITLETNAGVLKTPSAFTFTIEFQASSVSVRQKIEIYDFSIGAWTILDERPSTVGDTVLDFLVPDAFRYIDGQGLMRARVSYRQTAPVLSYPWQPRIDLVRWSIQE